MSDTAEPYLPVPPPDHAADTSVEPRCAECGFPIEHASIYRDDEFEFGVCRLQERIVRIVR